MKPRLRWEPLAVALWTITNGNSKRINEREKWHFDEDMTNCCSCWCKWCHSSTTYQRQALHYVHRLSPCLSTIQVAASINYLSQTSVILTRVNPVYLIPQRLIWTDSILTGSYACGQRRHKAHINGALIKRVAMATRGSQCTLACWRWDSFTRLRSECQTLMH